MAQDLFWATYESLEKRFPEFLTTSRNYPGLPYRFKNRTVRAVDSTTISLTARLHGFDMFGLPRDANDRSSSRKS